MILNELIAGIGQARFNHIHIEFLNLTHQRAIAEASWNTFT